MYNLVSFTGIFIIMAFAWLISENRKAINRDSTIEISSFVLVAI